MLVGLYRRLLDVGRTILECHRVAPPDVNGLKGENESLRGKEYVHARSRAAT